MLKVCRKLPDTAPPTPCMTSANAPDTSDERRTSDERAPRTPPRARKPRPASAPTSAAQQAHEPARRGHERPADERRPPLIVHALASHRLIRTESHRAPPSIHSRRAEPPALAADEATSAAPLAHDRAAHPSKPRAASAAPPVVHPWQWWTKEGARPPWQTSHAFKIVHDLAADARAPRRMYIDR